MLRPKYCVTEGECRQNPGQIWSCLLKLSKKTSASPLKDAAHTSSNSIAKLGKNEPVRMDVLIKIAKALDCKVEDLFETIKEEEEK